MSLAVPQLKKELAKAETRVRSQAERITLLALERDYALQALDKKTLVSDITSRIFMGFLMDASSLNELRGWFGKFLEESNAIADGEGGFTREDAKAILEKHGVTLRVPTVPELKTGRWTQ